MKKSTIEKAKTLGFTGYIRSWIHKCRPWDPQKGYINAEWKGKLEKKSTWQQNEATTTTKPCYRQEEKNDEENSFL